MKYIWKVLPAVLAAALLLTACAPKAPAGSAGSSGTGSGSSGAGLEETFVFTRETMPRLDGSTSTAPLARAMCAALLGEDEDQVSDLVRFSRTTQSYWNLMNGDADLLLAAEPTPEVMEELNRGDNWLLTPFATDALVFVVNRDNPVDSLTVEQVQKIYTGEITNWSQVGGEDLEIVPFQRNKAAGSQTMFEKLVMSGLELMDPPINWTADSMEGLLNAVREYDNSAAALGYTVYYYANDMEMARGLKVLAIDGVSPSAQAIRDKAYPFLNPYFVAIRKDLPQDSPTRILYDWVLGPEGQRLAAAEGYVPVTDPEGVDWSRPEGNGSAPQADVDGGRWFAGYTDHLITGEAYGPLVPYIGGQAYPFSRWEADGETQEYWSPWAASFYGLMTREGKIVTDPVYQSALSYSFQQDETSHTLPVLLLTRSDPAWEDFNNGQRYAVAAEDGSWCTDFEFLNYTNREEKLFLLGPEGCTVLDSETGARKDWSWARLGVSQAELPDVLEYVQWAVGLTWLDQGICLGPQNSQETEPEKMTVRMLDPDTGKVSWVSYQQWEKWQNEYFDRRWPGWDRLVWKGSQAAVLLDDLSYPLTDVPEGCQLSSCQGDFAVLATEESNYLYRLSTGKRLLEGEHITLAADAANPGLILPVCCAKGVWTVYSEGLEPLLTLPGALEEGWMYVSLRDGLLSVHDDSTFFGCYDLSAEKYIFFRSLSLGD